MAPSGQIRLNVLVSVRVTNIVSGFTTVKIADLSLLSGPLASFYIEKPLLSRIQVQPPTKGPVSWLDSREE
ncbi:hypothetical protein H2248_005463 [Termitomyces sp. 'cryptogamus']|nr:hypothetical protein H2248_005463 [Termitomyces sp. 'cryptogamus']